MSKQKSLDCIIDESDGAFQADFEKYIEQQNNKAVQKIVEELSPSVPLTSVVDFSGTSLLHLAAKYNNVDLIVYFARLGCNVNAKNAFDTPLSTAFVQYHVESVDALLNLGAELAIEDVERVLHKYIAENAVPEPTIAALTKKLRKCTEDTKKITKLLIKVKCPLKLIIYLGDACLTKTLLPNFYPNIEKVVLVTLEHVIKEADIENLKLLWQSHQLKKRTRNQSINPERAKIIKSALNSGYNLVFRRLDDWIFFDGPFINFLWELLRSVDISALRILLHECNIDVQLKQNHNFNVLPMLFSNSKTNNDMFRLVCNRGFDVNSRSFGGYSALHFATCHNLHEKINLLFDMGADCNVKDDQGLLAFYLINTAECGAAFLRGANQLRIGEFYVPKVLNVMQLNRDPTTPALRSILLARLAVESCQGVSIAQTILDEIRCRPFAQQLYDDYLLQVALMMNCEVLPNLTMFRLLTTTAEKLPVYIEDRVTITTITQWCSRRSLNDFYASSLKFNAERSYTLCRSRCRVADIIHKNTSIRLNYNDLVIDKIFAHLVYRDMLMLAAV